MFSNQKKRIYILFFIAFTIAPAVANGQAKELLLLNLGPLQTSGSWSVSAKYTVPAGKRLVIEQTFVEVNVPVGTKPRGYIRVETSTTYSWSGQYLPFQFTNQGNLFDVETIYSSSQAMKTYVTNPANSGYTKKVCFYISAPSGSATGSYASLSGYLEDAD